MLLEQGVALGVDEFSMMLLFFGLLYRLWHGLFLDLFAFELPLQVLGFHWFLDSVLSFIVLACEHANLFLSQIVK